MVTKTQVDATYRRENGLWNLSIDQLKLPKDFVLSERNIVYIPAGESAANHRHPRREVFVGIGDELYLVWLDQGGQRQEEKMMEGGQLYMFDIEPLTPHAVVNKGPNFAVILELADRPNIDVEQVNVLGVEY